MKSRHSLVARIVLAFVILLGGLSIVSAQTDDPFYPYNPRHPVDPYPYRASAFERVAQVADQGDITLREAVIAQAQLLYAPEDIGPNSAFAVRDDEVAVYEDCLFGFSQSVRLAYDQFDHVDKAYLSQLDPSLKTIIDGKEREALGIRGSSPNALPIYGLDKTEDGKHCVVHYTLAGDNAAPDDVYAQLVRLYIDKGIKRMTKKHFPKAYAEGYADYKGKMHVYIIKMSANGEYVPSSTVSGNKTAGYIKISNEFKTRYGKAWQLKLKGTSYHEYFHGIQTSYNVQSSIWFLEGQAVWCSCYYAKDWAHVKSYYDSASSMFNAPNQTIWPNTYRKYSTSVLAFYCSGKYKGWKFFKTYLEKSVTENNAVKLVKATIADNGGTFEDDFKDMWMGMYLKKLSPLKKKCMPDIKIEATHNAYGVDPQDKSVFLTGANIYVFTPQADAKGATFIGIFETSANKPEPFLVRDKKRQRIEFEDGRASVPRFGKGAKKVAYIVTDPNYAADDSTARAYKYSAICPYVNINDITAQSPIFAGQSSTININYDLLGTYIRETFPVTIKVVEKGPDVGDHVSGTYNLNAGAGQTQLFYFNTAWTSKGLYRFAFEYRVPQDAWNMKQVKSRKRCSVLVKQPERPTAAGPSQATLTP